MKRAFHSALATPLALLALLASACSNSGKSEAQALSDVVARYRMADATRSAGAASAVAAVECGMPEVCDAKKACLAFIEPTQRELALRRDVEKAMNELTEKRATGALGKEDPQLVEVAQKLEEAGRLREEGRAARDACAEKIHALHMKYQF